MEQKAKKILMLSAALAIQLLSSGCFFGGGGLSSFFGGAESSAAAAFFNSGSSESNDGGSYDGQGSGGLGEEASRFSDTNPDGSSIDVPQVAVLHNPEPASMILFGSGLAGLGFLRRRRFSKASK